MKKKNFSLVGGHNNNYLFCKREQKDSSAYTFIYKSFYFSILTNIQRTVLCKKKKKK